MARVVAASFAINDPTLRHLNIPNECPADVINVKHKDPFGDDYFGSWTKENIIFWLIRLIIFTEPFSALEAIALNSKALKQSLAAINNDGEIIGGAFNVGLDISNAGRSIRENDPFLNAVLLFLKPVSQLTVTQLNLSLNHIRKAYPLFLAALKAGKVGDLNMVARSPLMPSEDAFELVAASATHFQQTGFEFLIIAASNQWTGAACEVLGGVRVHFAPYRVLKSVDESETGIQDKPSSKDGFISDKDSGCMLYLIRLK